MADMMEKILKLTEPFLTSTTGLSFSILSYNGFYDTFCLTIRQMKIYFNVTHDWDKGIRKRMWSAFFIFTHYIKRLLYRVSRKSYAKRISPFSQGTGYKKAN